MATNCNESFKAHHLDQACLLVTNQDDHDLELWAQSKECHLCSPWKYLNIDAGKSSHLVVNSTYSTEFSLQFEGSIIDKYDYHFSQNGYYNLSINSSQITPISVIEEGNNEYLAVIIMASLFLSLLALRVAGGWCFRKLQDFYQSGDVDMEESHSSFISDENCEEESVEESVGHFPSLCVDEDRGSMPDTMTVSTRLQSLDAFRGLSIVLMIFVNYGGGEYYFFRHARWNGLTVADLVFPWFMWIMGVSLTFSIKSHLRRMTPYTTVILRIFQRSLSLFLLGLVVNSIGHNDINKLRIMGVLQRFSFCYLINSLIELFCMSPRDSNEYVRYWPIRDIVWSWMQWILISIIITAHLLITFLLSMPGCPRGYLGPGGLHENGSHPNCTGGATGYVDQLILSKRHMYQHPSCRVIYDNPGPFDPEGVLGILTSCLTVQLGVVAGRIILFFSRHFHRVKRMLIWGVFLSLLGGLLCHWRKEGGWIPVNKNLWSLSYVLVTAGFAFMLFAFLYISIDVTRWWSGDILRHAGMNSILLYVGHEITKEVFPWSWKPVGNSHLNHLLIDLWGTFLWMLIAYLLHRKRLYFSV